MLMAGSDPSGKGSNHILTTSKISLSKICSCKYDLNSQHYDSVKKDLLFKKSVNARQKFEFGDGRLAVAIRFQINHSRVTHFLAQLYNHFVHFLRRLLII